MDFPRISGRSDFSHRNARLVTYHIGGHSGAQSVQIAELPNGVVVASERMPGAYSVSIGIWVGWGSAHEEPRYNGISHFFEHMVFKGTRKRSSIQIAREIEDRGGSLNAYTTREHTCFYARVVREDLPLALDTLCDLVSAPLMSAEDVAKEQKVIFEEIRSYEDAPDEVAHDLFTALHFSGQGLAMPITGTLKTVKNIGREELCEHHRRLSEWAPLWVVAVGDFEHDWLVEECGRLLSFKGLNLAAIPPSSEGVGSGRGIRLMRKDIQQSNIVMGTSIPVRHSGHQRLALALFNLIFGDGMASRLFQKIREDHGLAYSVYSGVDTYSSCRSFTISLGTDARRHDQAIRLIRDEIELLLREGLRPGELERAKRAMLGNIKLGLDSPSNRMNRLARQILRTGSWSSIAELEHKLGTITETDILEVIRELFVCGRWGAAAVVPRSVRSVDFSPILELSGSR